MNLEQRQQRFNTVCSRFDCHRPGLLVAVYKIPEAQFAALKLATMFYMSRVLPNKTLILDEENILKEFSEQLEFIPNLTLNGKFMPKSYLTLEFNYWFRAVADIFEELQVNDLISTVRSPILRYKAAQSTEEHLKRPYATEKPHFETWVGHPKNTMLFHIPILGDLENNYLQFFSPPDDYEDSWSAQTTDFSKNEDIIKRYIPLDIHPQAGYLYIFDCTSLHATKRNPDAGSRISLEFAWLLKEGMQTQNAETTRQLDDEMECSQFFQIGKTKLFTPKDTMSGMIEIKEIIDF